MGGFGLSKREDFKKALSAYGHNKEQGGGSNYAYSKVVALYDEAHAEERIPLASLEEGDLVRFDNGTSATYLGRNYHDKHMFSGLDGTSRKFLGDDCENLLYVTKIKETPKQHAALELGVDARDVGRYDDNGFSFLPNLVHLDQQAMVENYEEDGGKFVGTTSEGFVSITAFKAWAGLV